MRRAASARVLALALLVASATARAETPIPPAPTRWVTDHAAFLSPAVADELDARLGGYDADTGHQVLVYIDRTTDGVPIEDWAVKAFAAWRVGRKGIDDGLVLFIFKEDHKLRIEVGYGLEDRVPDVVASRIVNDVMVPRIRAGDDDGAVRGGVDAIVAAIGAGPGGHAPAKIPLWQVVAGGIVLLVFLIFAVTHPALAWLLLLNIGSGRRGGGWGRGGGGFGGGGFGGGFSGGGGRSGGGGASGSW